MIWGGLTNTFLTWLLWCHSIDSCTNGLRAWIGGGEWGAIDCAEPCGGAAPFFAELRSPTICAVSEVPCNDCKEGWAETKGDEVEGCESGGCCEKRERIHCSINIGWGGQPPGGGGGSGSDNGGGKGRRCPVNAADNPKEGGKVDIAVHGGQREVGFASSSGWAIFSQNLCKASKQRMKLCSSGLAIIQSSSAWKVLECSHHLLPLPNNCCEFTWLIDVMH